MNSHSWTSKGIHWHRADGARLTLTGEWNLYGPRSGIINGAWLASTTIDAHYAAMANTVLEPPIGWANRKLAAR